MKYATLLLGLAIVLASCFTARAADDPQIFVCPPGKTVVKVLHDGEPQCSKNNVCHTIRAFVANGKEYPASSQLFRFDPGEQDTLHYRGRACLGPYER